jgi:hypothetical protein
LKTIQFRETIRAGGFPVDKIGPGTFSHERLIQITVNGKIHGGFAPLHHLNIERMLVEAYVVADTADGWLVRLPPACEMFSGDQFILKPGEQDRFVPM